MRTMVKVISMRLSHDGGASNIGVHDYVKIWLKNGSYLSGRIMNITVDGAAIDYIVIDKQRSDGNSTKYLVDGESISTIEAMNVRSARTAPSRREL